MEEISLIPRVITITNTGDIDRIVNISGCNQSFIMTPGLSVRLKVITSSEMLGYLSQADDTLIIDSEDFDAPIPEQCTFDASKWLTTNPGAYQGYNTDGRASTGIDHGWDYIAIAGAAPGNLETIDNWGWSGPSSALAKGPQDMTLEGKTYSFEWTFQTNGYGGSKGMLLNYFYLNNEKINIPLYPYGYVNGNSFDINSGAEYKKTTTLSDGTKVELEMLRAFNNDTQRVYKLSITNVTRDIVVTDGNLTFWYGEDPETLVPDYVAPPSLPTPIVSISDTGLATWDIIENAIAYEVDVNGTETTKNTYYQLSNGESIRVRAIGDGVEYSDSEWSETKSFIISQLDIPKVVINKATGLATWQSIGNALSYNVRIDGTTVYNISDTQYQLINGQSIEVQAVGDNIKWLNSEWTSQQIHIAPQLPTPNVTIDDKGLVTWEAIDNAISYNVKINSADIYNINETYYQIVEDEEVYGRDSQSIEVQAVADNIYYNDSEYSKSQIYSLYSMGLTFVSNSDGTCYVSSIGSCKDSYIKIPPKHSGEIVTEIGVGAFQNSDIKGVQIPDTTTIIQTNAFSDCKQLKEVVIPDNVTTIHAYAFQRCGMETLTIGKNLSTLGLRSNRLANDNTPFWSCGSLHTVYFNAISCTPITLNTFSDCFKLATFIFGDSVDTISHILHEVRSLTDVSISNSVKTITGAALALCANLEKITYNDTMKSWKSIKKATGWDGSTGDYKVYCIDGYIDKDGTEHPYEE